MSHAAEKWNSPPKLIPEPIAFISHRKDLSILSKHTQRLNEWWLVTVCMGEGDIFCLGQTHLGLT